MKHKSLFRRTVLGTLLIAATAAPPLASGCAAGFASVSQVDGLRVLAVVADKPYAKPGDTVTFTMNYEDGRDPARMRKPQILWLGGCFDPDGDQYYACYQWLLHILAELKTFLQTGNLADIPPDVLQYLGQGETFQLKLPDDIISRRPDPGPTVPYFGTAFAFFTVCEGHVGQAPAGAGGPSSSGGLAGSFPLGCFDDAGNPLGADSFVPGYTIVYSFRDYTDPDGVIRAITNDNPVVNGLGVTPSGVADAGDVGDGGTVAACDVSEADRQATGCQRKDPAQLCTQYNVTVEVPDNVAEVDYTTTGVDGGALTETVWVDYFADQGDIDTPVLLVSDAVVGQQTSDKYTTTWTPPPLGGSQWTLAADAGTSDQDAGPVTATLWAVVHDSRGGETVVSRTLTAK
jgi:hypothetical protein